MNTSRKMIQLGVPSKLRKVRLLNVKIIDWNKIDTNSLLEVYLGHSIDTLSYDLKHFEKLQKIVCINECLQSKEIKVIIPVTVKERKSKGLVKIIEYKQK